MGDIASRARVFINSLTAQNKFLSKCKSSSESDDSDIEHAFNTNGEVAGEIEKPGGGSLELEVYEETNGVPEVDYIKLKDSKEYFSITRHFVPTGRRMQYQNCRVANVASESDSEGNQMMTVKIIWRTRKAL